MYLVYYTSGSYEDYQVTNVFVTEHEYKAKFWRSKFDNIINKTKQEFREYDIDEEVEKYNNGFLHRYFDIMDVNGAYYIKIDCR